MTYIHIIFIVIVEHILSEDVISDIIEIINNNILNKFDNFNAKNTKYTFDRVIQLDLQSDKYTPLRGGTYVKLPNYIIAKNAALMLTILKLINLNVRSKKILDALNMQ